MVCMMMQEHRCMFLLPVFNWFSLVHLIEKFFFFAFFVNILLC
jgi:hypothetical protein